MGLTHASPVTVFVVCCLAILPLAGLMGEATEHLTHHTGPGIGGLLNASFGNAAELIIAFMALRAGEIEIVKASLTGSIIGNMLMVLGLAMLLGGWKRKELRFNRLAAESGSSMMVLAVVAPGHPRHLRQRHPPQEPGHIESISLDISLGADPDLRREPRLPAQDPRAPVRGAPARATTRSTSDGALVGEEEHGRAARGRGAGRAGERVPGARRGRRGRPRWAWARCSWAWWWWPSSATRPSTPPPIIVAMKGKMDLALGIAMGSSMQIALFVAPVLVIAGHFMGTPLGLEFTILEVVAVMLSVGRRRPADPRRQDELVRRPPAPGHLHDPGDRVLFRLRGRARATHARPTVACPPLRGAGRGVGETLPAGPSGAVPGPSWPVARRYGAGRRRRSTRRTASAVEDAQALLLAGAGHADERARTAAAEPTPRARRAGGRVVRVVGGRARQCPAVHRGRRAGHDLSPWRMNRHLPSFVMGSL